MTLNYSLYSIPVYWFLTLAPHAYAVSTVKKANNGNWDHTNPRNTNYLEKTLPCDVLARYQRAEAAHANGIESAPFFVGAVLAGNWVGLGASTMNAYAGMYVGSRVVYNLVYINTETQRKSRARSIAWVAGALSLFVLWFKAAGKMLVES